MTFVLCPSCFSQSHPSQPTNREVDAIRRQLLEQNRQREDLARQSEIVGFDATNRRSPQPIDRRRAGLCLTNEMDILHAVWSLEPFGSSAADSAPLRVPLCLKGEQWITLAPGRWRASLLFGAPDGGRLGRLPPREIKVEAGRRYELLLADRTEHTLKQRLEPRPTRQPDRQPPDANQTGLRHFVPAQPPSPDASIPFADPARPDSDSAPAPFGEPASTPPPARTPASRGPRVVEEFTRK